MIGEAINAIPQIANVANTIMLKRHTINQLSPVPSEVFAKFS